MRSLQVTASLSHAPDRHLNIGYRAAYQAWDNRKKLDSIEKLLSEIEAGLQQVMPSEDLKT